MAIASWDSPPCVEAGNGFVDDRSIGAACTASAKAAAASVHS
jgi:hypothetical protein